MRIGWLAVLCLFSVLCALTMGTVDAVAQTFKVSAGKEIIKPVGLNEGDVVSGRIYVIGGSTNDIKFYVTEPNGNVVVQFDKAGATDFGFTASKTGTYTLHFDNTLSDSEKTVTLNYEVRHYLFGMPLEYFYALVVLFVGLVGVMVYVALART